MRVLCFPCTYAGKVMSDEGKARRRCTRVRVFFLLPATHLWEPLAVAVGSWSCKSCRGSRHVLDLGTATRGAPHSHGASETARGHLQPFFSSRQNRAPQPLFVSTERCTGDCSRIWRVSIFPPSQGLCSCPLQSSAGPPTGYMLAGAAGDCDGGAAAWVLFSSILRSFQHTTSRVTFFCC